MLLDHCRIARRLLLLKLSESGTCRWSIRLHFQRLAEGLVGSAFLAVLGQDHAEIALGLSGTDDLGKCLEGFFHLALLGKCHPKVDPGSLMFWVDGQCLAQRGFGLGPVAALIVMISLVVEQVASFGRASTAFLYSASACLKSPSRS